MYNIASNKKTCIIWWKKSWCFEKLTLLKQSHIQTAWKFRRPSWCPIRTTVWDKLTFDLTYKSSRLMFSQKCFWLPRRYCGKNIFNFRLTWNFTSITKNFQKNVTLSAIFTNTNYFFVNSTYVNSPKN